MLDIEIKLASLRSGFFDEVFNVTCDGLLIGQIYSDDLDYVGNKVKKWFIIGDDKEIAYNTRKEAAEQCYRSFKAECLR